MSYITGGLPPLPLNTTTTVSPTTSATTSSSGGCGGGETEKKVSLYKLFFCDPRLLGMFDKTSSAKHMSQAPLVIQVTAKFTRQTVKTNKPQGNLKYSKTAPYPVRTTHLRVKQSFTSIHPFC